MSSLDEVFGTERDKPLSGDLITASGDLYPAAVPNNGIEQNVEDDYEQTRSNIHSLLDTGNNALLHALEVAKSSEHPRAFEVVGNLLKQLGDLNHQLLDLSQKRQKILEKTPDDVGATKTINNNAIFVGSTTELNKALKQIMKGDNE